MNPRNKYRLFSRTHDSVISYHRTPAAVFAADAKLQRGVKASHGEASYIETEFQRWDAASETWTRFTDEELDDAHAAAGW